MTNYAWLELCEVSITLLEEIGAKPLDPILLSLGALDGGDHCSEVTSMVLQAFPAKGRHEDSTKVIRVHPDVYDYLECASSTCQNRPTNAASAKEHFVASVTIEPLLLENHFPPEKTVPVHVSWTLERLKLVDLPADSTIHCTCLYTEDQTLDRHLELSLESRIVRAGSIISLPKHSFLVVHCIFGPNGEPLSSQHAFRIRFGREFEVLLSADGYQPPPFFERSTHQEWEEDCPGYDSFVKDLVALFHMPGPVCPSGVLVTGGPKVGKSRLVSCMAHLLAPTPVHWVSAQDLIMRASFTTHASLMDVINPPLGNQRCVLVLDDLHLISVVDSLHDPEMMVVRNAILEAIDRSIASAVQPFIIGITRVATQLPREITKIGRLEKEVSMSAPTQVQREAVLRRLLQADTSRDLCEQWISLLIPLTAGCVAGDLRRLYVDALTRAQSRVSGQHPTLTWNDFSEAAHRIVPSELAQLDVIKAPMYPHATNKPAKWIDIHRWSWRGYGGYLELKRRIYTTVVSPWRRYMTDSLPTKGSKYQIAPPRGVIFHGKPGTGKTLAAECLASSLGLHVVRVRASDILNQWLGGSEAAVRSLFGRARAASPCILFFDEIDAIAATRFDEGSGNDVSSRILTTFLNEMDGIASGVGSQGGVLVVACTNRLEAIDTALLRPGRLDEHVYIPLPRAVDVLEMLQIHLVKVPLSPDVDLNTLADELVVRGATGADVEGLCRDACSSAIRQATELLDEVVVSQHDLLESLRKWRR
jgi:SpoVK/Ycf46/Vps4 family AAA+-type ATPase